MNDVSEPAVYTPDDLFRMRDGKYHELAGGRLIERKGNALTSWIGAHIGAQVGIAAAGRQIGWCFSSTCGYQCFPDAPTRVRRPDFSFIRRGRPPGDEIPDGHVPIHSDLAAEVVSPNDLFYEVEEKVEEYRTAGVPLVWVVNPRTRTVYVYRRDGSVTHLREEDELTAEDLIPGFRCLVSALFPPQTAPSD